MTSDRYQVEIAGLTRELQVVEVPSGVRIAFLNAAGDTELIVRGVRRLLELAPPFDVVIGPALVGAILAHQVSVETGRPYAIARKLAPVDAPRPLSAVVRSIKAAESERLYLGTRDAASLHNKRVLIVDDVVGTGDTMRAVAELTEAAGGDIAGRIAFATEGTRRDDITSLVHLPIFEL